MFILGEYFQKITIPIGIIWSYSVVVITPDFESGNLSSNLSKTSYFLFFYLVRNK